MESRQGAACRRICHRCEGAAEGTVVVAEEQTAGKGRPGKTFFSPAATGLYLSIVLRPTLAADRGQFITCAAAVACAQGDMLVRCASRPII